MWSEQRFTYGVYPCNALAAFAAAAIGNGAGNLANAARGLPLCISLCITPARSAAAAVD